MLMDYRVARVRRRRRFHATAGLSVDSDGGLCAADTTLLARNAHLEMIDYSASGVSAGSMRPRSAVSPST
jgi:hypothetical protein